MDLKICGERIKDARIEKKLTLEKLSEQIGISRNFLWEIEAGRKAPAIQTLYSISKTLNLSVDYIFGTVNDNKWIYSSQEQSIRKEIDENINSLDNSELYIINELIKTYKFTAKKELF